MYARLVNRFSATRAGSWMVRHVAAPIDPILFKRTNGRFTLTGKPTLPMLALTVVGRRSGEPRTVQLAYETDGDSFLVVASAMGQERHPAWRYNLEAAGGGSVQLPGRVVAVTATVLGDDEKAAAWAPDQGHDPADGHLRAAHRPQHPRLPPHARGLRSRVSDDGAGQRRESRTTGMVRPAADAS